MELGGQKQDVANEKCFVIKQSAICDHLGNVLAKSAGFIVAQEDLKNLVQCFVKPEPDSTSAVGIMLAGDFYKFDSITEHAIKANHGSVRLHCIKTEETVCVMIYECPIQLLVENVVEDNFDSLKLNRDENVFDNFGKMNLKEPLLRGISVIGLTHPSLLHKFVIVPAVKKHDVIVQCQSGTVERATTFLIPIIERIDTNIKACQAIIVTPSHAKGKEIQKIATSLGSFMDLKCLKKFKFEKERRSKKSSGCDEEVGFQVAVGTPLEILRDLSGFKPSELLDVKVVVFDEAEHYICNRNLDKIYGLMNTLNADIQIILFVSNMTKALFEFNTRILKQPVQIIVKSKKLALDGVKHFYLKLDEIEWKLENLFDIIGKLNKTTQFIIFCDRKETVDLLCATLNNRNFTVAVVVDNVPRNECQSRLDNFRSGVFQVLLTTNFCCIFKVNPVPLVINYDLPVRKEYFTRIHGVCGLTKLIVINFAAGKEDDRALVDIERSCGIKMHAIPPNFVSEIER